MFLRVIILHGQACNKAESLVLFKIGFKSHLRGLAAFGETSEMNHGETFLKNLINELSKDLRDGQSLQAANGPTGQRHIPTTKVCWRFPTAFQYAQRKAADVFDSAHLQNKLSLKAGDRDDLLLLGAASG